MKQIIKEVFQAEEKVSEILKQARNKALEIRRSVEKENSEKMSDAKQKAREIIQTTVEDAGPMMVTECLMNNTRVVSFDNCVSPDVIEEGKTGFVVPTFDTEALSDALIKAYDTKDFLVDCTKKCLEFNSKESFKQKWFDFLSEVIK